MRFSLATTAALALLGAESLFLGINGAPLAPPRNTDSSPYQGLCLPGQVSTSEGCQHSPAKRAGGGGGRLVGGGEGKGGGKGDDGGSSSGGAGKSGSKKGDEGGSSPNPGSFKDIGEPKKTYPPKAITDPFDGTYRYRLEDSKADPDDHLMDYGKLYDVRSEYYYNWDEPVDTIGIRKDDNSINTIAAYNKDQKFQGGMQYKDHPVRLSDIQMYLFVNKGGKRPQDLNVMRFDTIIEDDTINTIEDTLAKYPPKSDGSLPDEVIVASNAKQGSLDHETYEALMKTPLGQNVDKINQQFGVGKQIQSIKITHEPAKNHLEFRLGN